MNARVRFHCALGVVAQVNSQLQTSNPDVYAIGDIALYPQPQYNNETTRMEHVQVRASLCPRPGPASHCCSMAVSTCTISTARLSCSSHCALPLSAMSRWRFWLEACVGLFVCSDRI